MVTVDAHHPLWSILLGAVHVAADVRDRLCFAGLHAAYLRGDKKSWQLL